MGRNKLLAFSILTFSIALIISVKIFSTSLEKSAYEIRLGLESINKASGPVVNTSVERDVMSIQQASNYLGISDSSLKRSIENKEIDIPYVRIESNYIFSKQAILKWMESKGK
jgi:excisionase family DNA binding protein